MEKFYFTYGTDRGYPFQRGWTLIVAPNIDAAIQIFKAYHPNRPGSNCLNCADFYRAEYFEKSECFKDGNFGAGCHEIIGPYVTVEEQYEKLKLCLFEALEHYYEKAVSGQDHISGAKWGAILCIIEACGLEEEQRQYHQKREEAKSNGKNNSNDPGDSCPV